MEIRDYEHARHFELVRSWLTARDMSPEAADDLPAIGYVAYEGALPFAAIFLRQVEGMHGIVEGLITNPHAPAKIRSIGNDALFRSVIGAARELEFKSITGYSALESVLLRMEKHGFKRQPHVLITLKMES